MKLFEEEQQKQVFVKTVERKLFYIRAQMVYFVLQNVFTHINIKKTINVF